jgi:hypothetical protein
LVMNLQWTGVLVCLLIASAVAGLFALRRLSKT